jgi:2-polyprenyl-3-methyl-5-hydroxy-6-metoxy-1,4-benzoquinol methylase
MRGDVLDGRKMNSDQGYYQYVRPEVGAFLPPNPVRVLEVGCGMGKFRQNLKTQCEYWGVEQDAKIGALAKSTLDNVLIGMFADVFKLLPDNYFDLIVCNDVIEHMSDHDWFLQSIQEKMIKGQSFLVGSNPNVRYVKNLFALLAKKDWRYTDSGILDRTHLRFFTEKSLKRTLTANGFAIEEFYGINRIDLRVRSAKSLVVSSCVLLAALFLGNDISFLQFGFRVSLTK